MRRSGPLFQEHHGIEQQTLRNSELLADLARQGSSIFMRLITSFCFPPTVF